MLCNTNYNLTNRNYAGVEQGNVEMIKEIINSKNIKDPMYPQSVLLVDSATGQTALHIAAANIRHVRSKKKSCGSHRSSDNSSS